MSPMVSFMRRSDPATEARSTPSTSIRRFNIACATRIREAQRRSIGCAALLDCFEVGDDLFFEFRADAGQSGEFAVARGCSNSATLVMPACSHSSFDALRSHVRHVEQFDDAGRDGLLQPIEQIERSGGEQRIDLVGDGLADAGDRAQFAGLRDRVDIPIEIGDLLGDAAIGDDRELVFFAFDVEHIGEQ